MKHLKNYLNPKAQWKAPDELSEKMTRDEALSFFRKNGFAIYKEHSRNYSDLYFFMLDLSKKHIGTFAAIYDPADSRETIRIFDPSTFETPKFRSYSLEFTDKPGIYRKQREYHSEGKINYEIRELDKYSFDEIKDLIKKVFDI